MRSRDRDRVAREPRPTPGLGRAPAYLSAEQRAIWARLVAAAPAGLLTRLDRELVEGFCVLEAARETLLRMFNDAGGTALVTSADRRDVLAPALREFRRLSSALVELGRELGMSPASRSHIAIQPPAPNEDPLAEFLWPPR